MFLDATKNIRKDKTGLVSSFKCMYDFGLDGMKLIVADMCLGTVENTNEGTFIAG